jgi:hypothetical protein
MRARKRKFGGPVRLPVMISAPMRLLLLVAGPGLFLHAQSVTDEELLDGGTETISAEALERLEEWKLHPLNMNRADAGDIAALPVVTPALAGKIVRERKDNGPFLNADDFRQRCGLDRSLAETLSQWALFSVPENRDKWEARVRVRAQRESPASEGFRNGRYAGSALQTCERLDLNFRDVLLGGLFLEKDPGETRWNDEVAGFLQVRNASRTFRLTAGRFVAEAGRGLVLWSAAGLFLGSDPAAPVRETVSAVRGIASPAGNSALSGAALEWRTRFIRAMACVSKSRVDATLDSNGAIKAVQTTGLHRTASEIEGGNAAAESLIGADLQAGNAGFRIGASGLWTRYGETVRAANPERRPFGFIGRSNAVAGVYWNFSRGPAVFTGECGRSRSGGTAWTAGLAVESGKVLLVVSLRRIGADFQNPRASGFGGGALQNEAGGYSGLTVRFSERTRMTLFSDLFRTPARTWLVPVPSGGGEWMLSAEHECSAVATVRLKARMRDGMRMEDTSGPAGSGQRQLIDRTTRSMRIELEMKPKPGLRLRSRIESVNARVEDPESSSAESGLLFLGELQFRKSQRYGISIRWATFDSDSYDSRSVVVENDLPGGAGLVPLYLKGDRWTVVLRWHAAPALSVILKYGATLHAFSETWGSGNDRIKGNLERKWTIQVDWKR